MFGAVVNFAASSHAAPASFAQFSEAAPGGNLFRYIDNGPAGDAQFGTFNGVAIGDAIPVNFTYLTVQGGLPADLIGNQAAHLKMTSSTLAPVQLGFFNTVGAQPILGNGTLVNTIEILRDLPANEGNGARTNLLTVTFTAQLTGLIGGRTPQLSGDTGLGFTVNYTSDFISFDNEEQDFSLTFSSWTSLAEQIAGGGLALSSNPQSSYFASAIAAGAGTFGGTARGVPEPGTLVLAGMSGLGMALVAWRRRRAAK